MLAHQAGGGASSQAGMSHCDAAAAAAEGEGEVVAAACGGGVSTGAACITACSVAAHWAWWAALWLLLLSHSTSMSPGERVTK